MKIDGKEMNGHNNKYYMELKTISGWNEVGETSGTQIPHNLWPFTLPYNIIEVILKFYSYFDYISPYFRQDPFSNHFC